MEKIKRAIHFDFHTMPNIKGMLAKFEAEKFALKLKENHVQYINFPARCNVGFSYYNTKLGTKYPGLERDILKEILDACHNQGIKVIAYMNAGLNHELAANNMELCKMFKSGKRINEDFGGHFFRSMCYNTEYGKILEDEVFEIVSNYDVDGVFLDCMQTEPCYCPICTKEMQERGVDMDVDSQLRDYQQSVITRVAENIVKVVAKTGKNIRTFFNGVPWREDLFSHVELECLPTGGWGYDYFRSCAPYFRNRSDELIYMSARFQFSWGDFGGLRTPAALEFDMIDAMMYGYAISFGDHMHPVDGMEDEVIERIGKVFEKKMQYEPFDEDAKPVVEVGVLIDRKDSLAPIHIKGLAKMLCELKLPYNIYDTELDFSAAKLLIIPKAVELNDSVKAKLLEFKNNGGKILFAGDAIDVAKELGVIDYVEVLGNDTADNTYFTLPNSTMRWGSYNPCKLIKNNGGIELSKYVSNVFNKVNDGRHIYAYFPQGNVTDMSTAITDGNTAVICFDVFTSYYKGYLKEQKQLVSLAINSLLKEKFIEVEGLPSTACISVLENSLNKIVHVKTTYPELRGIGRGIIEEHNLVKDATITIKGEYKVYTLPEMKKVKAKVKGGKTVFNTGEILGHKAFSLRTK